MVDEESSGYYKTVSERIRSEIIHGSQIFLDYDGTLVPIVINPEECYADEKLKKLLSDISKNYELFIVSGRQISELRKFIGLDLNFIGMHGAVSYMNGREIPLVPGFYHYADRVKEISEMHLEYQYKGLRVYDKSSGILFHLGLVDAAIRDEITGRVEDIAKMYHMDLYRGKNVLELKIPGVNKGDAIRKFRNSMPCMIAGDEGTDEMAFNECRECLTIHVGTGKTIARYSVPDVYSFRKILEIMIQ
ncbi:trehalose-phosphatase [Cuniculiplasma sp. SKW3]|uniref:trehalose-phosphatase n=1 Tax=Cuniculiplasma sp. SKW3 TaxID=3400170 RepID=UPI003FD13FC6